MNKAILLFFFFYPIYTTAQFTSPCPSLFTYDNISGDSWTGTLRVPVDRELSGIWINTEFDRAFNELTSDFGESVHREPNEYLIRRPQPKVDAWTILTIRITAKNHPMLGAPQLLSYRLNGKTICPTPPVESLNALTADSGPLKSPCPTLFTYEPLGVDANRWYGNINVRSPLELHGVWMRVVLDKTPVDFGTEFGTTEQKELNEFLVRNPKHHVNVGDVLKFQVHADFIPGETPPRLLGYRLYGRTVCPTNGIILQPTSELPISPCPSLFQYEPHGLENDTWNGTVNIVSDLEMLGVWLRIVFDKPIISLGTLFGGVKTDDNTTFRINRRDYKIAPGKVVPVRFFIQYNPAEPVPKVKEIKLNAVTICPAGNIIPNSANFSTQTQVAPVTQSSIHQLTTAAPGPPLGKRVLKPDWSGAFKPPIAVESQCGEVATRFGDNVTEEGQWPWHAALYSTGGSTPEYYCGGVLVSLNHVLSAAHCVVSQETTPINTTDVQVYLGKHLLSRSTRGVQFKQIRRILIQPEYDNNNYANDIALLYLSRPAEYTDWVRPVCLWSESIDLSSVENKEGTVVGWGYDNTGHVTEKLLKAVMPVVSHRKCIWSNKQFYKRIVNDRNFCAGFRNDTSVCTGDSGSGLVFPIGDSTTWWQIRGLVSLSVALQDSVSACDTSHFVVFTDVAKFLPWIQQAMNSG